MNKDIIIAGLIMLIVGLGIGYAVSGGISDSDSRIKAGSHMMSDGSLMGDGNMDMQGSMEGMMEGLEGKTGDAFDRAFLEEMIVHHEGAVLMAETLLKNTKRPELQKLGSEIITAQTGEIQMMKVWLESWY